MAKGSWAATDASSIIVAADGYRGEITVQCTANGPVWLGFGEAAVAGQGLCLTEGGSITIDDHRAIKAVHAVCGTGATAAGGYQTA
jgi:hypothetical protein